MRAPDSKENPPTKEARCNLFIGTTISGRNNYCFLDPENYSLLICLNVWTKAKSRVSSIWNTLHLVSVHSPLRYAATWISTQTLPLLADTVRYIIIRSGVCLNCRGHDFRLSLYSHSLLYEYICNCDVFCVGKRNRPGTSVRSSNVYCQKGKDLRLQEIQNALSAERIFVSTMH